MPAVTSWREIKRKGVTVITGVGLLAASGGAAVQKYAHIVEKFFSNTPMPPPGGLP